MKSPYFPFFVNYFYCTYCNNISDKIKIVNELVSHKNVINLLGVLVNLNGILNNKNFVTNAGILFIV